MRAWRCTTGARADDDADSHSHQLTLLLDSDTVSAPYRLFDNQSLAAAVLSASQVLLHCAGKIADVCSKSTLHMCACPRRRIRLTERYRQYCPAQGMQLQCVQLGEEHSLERARAPCKILVASRFFLSEGTLQGRSIDLALRGGITASQHARV